MNGTTKNGELSVSPPLLFLSCDNLQNFEIRTKNENGVYVPARVQLSLSKIFEGCFIFTEVLTGILIDWTVDGDRIVAECKTNPAGSLLLNAGLTSSAVPASPYPVLSLSASLGGSQPDEVSVPIQVVREPPPPPA